MTVYDIGDLRVDAVEELPLAAGTGAWLMPELPEDVVAAHPDLQPDHVDAAHRLRLHSHSFALTVDGQRIVVDTGVGDAKPRANPAWNDLHTDYLANLVDAGYAPQDVDLVIMTHLHADHVGWNTRRRDGEWMPNFPNARYLMSAREWSYWNDVTLEPEREVMIADSVLPVRDAGLLDTVDVDADGVDVAPGVRLVAAPGHTPGQVTVHLRAAGERAVISGDAVHHPIQLLHPDVVTRADVDPTRTVRTRGELLADLADHGGVLLGTHFDTHAAGRVRRVGNAFGFTPMAG